MPKGVEVRLYNAAGSPMANQTAIEVVWLDSASVVDFTQIKGKSGVLTTDADGWIKIDLDNVTGLAVGEFGFLICYKRNLTDHRDSPVFASKLEVASIASGTSIGPVSTWVRPAAWLAMPSIISSDEKFAGLHAVWPEGNFVAFSAAGNYTVDWGDGSATQNVASGGTAEKEITWASALNTSDVGIATAVACTFQDTGDTVTLNAHGWANGRAVAFSAITSTTGISTYTTYYVVSQTTNTFQVASTIGGSAIALTTNGSGSVYVPQYRQVIITVVPNASTITQLNLHVKHSTALLQTYSSLFLDIAMSFAAMTDLRIGVQTPGDPTQVINFSELQRASIVNSDLRQLDYLFFNNYKLLNIAQLVTSATASATLACTFQDAGDTVTATAHGFRNGDTAIFTSITSTTEISAYSSYFVVGQTANTFQVAFSYGGDAIALTTDGSGNVVRGTNFSNMFNSCSALQSLPLFNTAAGTSFSSMFINCYSLQSLPLFNTAAGADFSSMFNSCSALQSLPLFNTAAGTNFSSMFISCYSLQSVPLFNTAAGTNFSSMFISCLALQSLPLFNTAAGTGFSNMFNNCFALQSVPLFNTAAGTSFSSMFINCFALQSVPLFNTAAGTSFSNMFNNCRALQSVPLFNTAAGTNFSSMFINCYSLQSVPLFNTAAGTNFGSMFNNCRTLQSVPLFNTAAGTIFSNMFISCFSLQSAALAGTPITHSYTGCKLSATELNRIYTNLKSGVAARTITVSNNYGTAGDNPSIATAKGWTVTG